jgi:hypothetical protein
MFILLFSDPVNGLDNTPPDGITKQKSATLVCVTDLENPDPVVLNP